MAIVARRWLTRHRFVFFVALSYARAQRDYMRRRVNLSVRHTLVMRHCVKINEPRIIRFLPTGS